MSRFFENERKSLLYQLGIFIICMAGVFIMYLFIVNRLEDKKDIERTIDKSTGLAWEVSYSSENNKLSGWVLKNGVTVNKIKLVLKNVETGESIVLSTVQSESEEVQKYFLEEMSYGEIAFEKNVDNSLIEETQCYEIIFALSYKDAHRDKKTNYSSNKYLYDGRLYSYNPLEFTRPKFIDEKMRKVVEDGEVKLFSKEQGIWIYQYENMFYHIADENFPFAEVGKTHISYHVRTSQNELLPEIRQQYQFDNLDFRFENKELQFSTEEQYRVASVAVPSGYPVISIYFAIYDDITRSVIWGDFFR